MARIEIFGLAIEYELLGPKGAPAIALTPGGRFPMNSPGLPELGQAVAAGGRRVLLWDRPNCGASDICFEGESESDLQARTLIELIRTLELGPTALAGGSAGSRVSLIAASRNPEAVSHLILWWISGGAISLISLAAYYCVNSAIAASRGGMAAVAALPGWAQQIQRNPHNRDIILSQDSERFLETMERWAVAYMPSATSPVPGMSPAAFARLRMPVLIFRNGKSDLSHTRRTSEWVHELIPHSQLVAPPWPDDEWNRRSDYAAEHGSGHFAGWPMLAPAIVEFTRR
ncbi:MAG TPA: alpha/beta hydrolase [Steroidobacteraceae bacterium]|nr:alpha/beta hydrolase [Steroidobacteraceae bacterium]